MPIDFHSQAIFTIPRPAVYSSSRKTSGNTQLQNDFFIKNVNPKIDKNFDGMKIEKKSFGKIEKTNEEATLYTITNKNGLSVDLSTYGATITSIKVPDKNGNLKDITHGYNSVTPYEKAPVGHAGGTIGPCANKINNGTFKINDKEYQLECNKDNGKTHSHGGSDGFDTKNWQTEILKDGIKFTYTKKDMESGYPGNVTASVTYQLDNNNKLHIKYHAETDQDTLINMTNHTYFNLDGAENTEENSVLDHIVELPNSSRYTVNNELAVPTGELASVKDTPFDFKKLKKLKTSLINNQNNLKSVQDLTKTIV